jgi:hypothetical protein
MSELTKQLNLYPIDYPFETLNGRIANNKLKLDPDFQRKYKWDNKGWGRASKFIESCLMRIPLPSCYFAEESDSSHIVIDGVQRLTTIQKFFNDDFPLEGMTAFKELEGKKFSQLGDLKSDLENTTIRCIILRKDNPQELIREIFARLNQGSVKLTDQEIRHAIYPGLFNNLLGELSNELKEYNFKAVTDESGYAELVLRYFAISSNNTLSDYSDKLKEYLDQYAEDKCSLSSKDVEIYKSSFLKALKHCKLVFGDDIFQNLASQNNITSKAIAHYDLQMYSLGQLDEKFIKSYALRIKEKYKELCDNDEFTKTLYKSLQKKSLMRKRRDLWDDLIKDVMSEENNGRV